MKNNSIKVSMLVVFLISAALVLLWMGNAAQAQEIENTHWIAGTVHDGQDQPVEGAQLALIHSEEGSVIYEAESQPDGRYILVVPEGDLASLEIHIERPHFKGKKISISEDIVDSLEAGKPLIIPTITMDREITIAFWIATIVFVGVLILIATGMGALASRRLAGKGFSLEGVLGAALLMAILFNFASGPILSRIENQSAPWKISLSIFLVGPLFFTMGFPFPLLLTRVKRHCTERLFPWMIGINSIATLMGGVLAIAMAMRVGYRSVLLSGAGLSAM